MTTRIPDWVWDLPKNYFEDWLPCKAHEFIGSGLFGYGIFFRDNSKHPVYLCPNADIRGKPVGLWESPDESWIFRRPEPEETLEKKPRVRSQPLPLP